MLSNQIVVHPFAAGSKVVIWTPSNLAPIIFVEKVVFKNRPAHAHSVLTVQALFSGAPPIVEVFVPVQVPSIQESCLSSFGGAISGPWATANAPITTRERV